MERLNELLSQYKLPMALSFIGLVLILGGIFSSGISQKTTSQMKYPEKSIVNISDTLIKVDISGAVVQPGVYSLAVNSRVEDAIALAGGFAQNVNQKYISKSLNLSQKISDGAKIYIPFNGEEGLVAGIKSSISQGIGSKIGINSATKDQLDELPGVGPVTSQKIIDARPFSSIEELLSKKVVSRSVYDKIKEQVDIN